jgi:hypothetical protein
MARRRSGLFKQTWQIAAAMALLVSGCNKTSAPPPAVQPPPDYEAIAAADEAAALERAARAHLSASMTDEQILRAIGVDPASVKLRPGPEILGDGHSTQASYTNETADIEISREPGTPYLFISQMDQGIHWLVKNKKP